MCWASGGRRPVQATGGNVATACSRTRDRALPLAWYAFISGTDLLDTLQFKDSNDLVRARTEWDYDTHRDLVTSRQNIWSDQTVVSQYDYAYDNLDLRTHKQRNGAAFAGPFYEQYSVR